MLLALLELLFNDISLALGIINSLKSSVQISKAFFPSLFSNSTSAPFSISNNANLNVNLMKVIIITLTFHFVLYKQFAKEFHLVYFVYQHCVFDWYLVKIELFCQLLCSMKNLEVQHKLCEMEYFHICLLH